MSLGGSLKFEDLHFFNSDAKSMGRVGDGRRGDLRAESAGELGEQAADPNTRPRRGETSVSAR